MSRSIRMLVARDSGDCPGGTAPRKRHIQRWLATLAALLAAAGVLIAGALPSSAVKEQPPALSRGGITPSQASACDSVTGNIVTNCGFERSFTGWTQGGDLTYTGVDRTVAHTGAYGAFLGPIGSDGTLRQRLTSATAGRTYTLNFYLRDVQRTGNDFSVTIDRVVLPNGTVGPQRFDLPAPGSADWRQFSYTFRTPSSGFIAPTLTFAFRNDQWFWYLDDISVVAR